MFPPFACKYLFYIKFYIITSSMTVSGESLTEMRLQEKKTLENVLINDCCEALEMMLSAWQSGAIKPHFF